MKNNWNRNFSRAIIIIIVYNDYDYVYYCTDYYLFGFLVYMKGYMHYTTVRVFSNTEPSRPSGSSILSLVFRY